jgi:hypothetical protein
MSNPPDFSRSAVFSALSETAEEKKLAAGREQNGDYKGAVEHLKKALSAQGVAVLRKVLGI